MDSPDDRIGLNFKGHVLIRDAITKEVLVDKFNAIHFENMASTLVTALSGQAAGHIYQMVFGNGATSVSAVNTITYFPPNVIGTNAQLYNQTYAKVVDTGATDNVNPHDNNVTPSPAVNTTYSDVGVLCTLEFGEPVGQSVFDDASNVNGLFIFNELGLKAYDQNGHAGKLLSHVVFHPVQKALNRTIEVVYTIRLVLA